MAFTQDACPIISKSTSQRRRSGFYLPLVTFRVFGLISVLCFFPTLCVLLATDSGIKSSARTGKKKHGVRSW